MAELPTMPFFTDAYLADTKHLSTLEHGAYFLLLISMWRAGGSLPTDETLLARYAGLSKSDGTPARNWPTVWAIVGPLFQVEAGRLVQKKLVSTYKKAIEKRDKFRENGKRGGEAKALKSKDTSLAGASNPPEVRQPAGATNLNPESINPNGKESGADAPARKSKPRASTLPPEIEPAHKAYFDRARDLKFGEAMSGQVAQLLKAHGFHREGATIQERLGAIQKARANLEAAASATVPRRYLAAIIKRLGDTEAASMGVSYDPAF